MTERRRDERKEAIREEKRRRREDRKQFMREHEGRIKKRRTKKEKGKQNNE